VKDAELVLRARGGDELAFRRLYGRYEGMVIGIARKYFVQGASFEDLKQEALLGFHKAVRDYRPGRESGFRHFAGLCVRRQVITAVKAATRNKHTPLNRATSLDQPAPGIEEGTLGEVVPDRRYAVDPVAAIEHDEFMSLVDAAVNGSLSGLERRAFAAVLEGTAYEAIAAAERQPLKSVDNAVQRARNKLAPVIELAGALPTRQPTTDLGVWSAEGVFG